MIVLILFGLKYNASRSNHQKEELAKHSIDNSNNQDGGGDGDGHQERQHHIDETSTSGVGPAGSTLGVGIYRGTLGKQ